MKAFGFTIARSRPSRREKDVGIGAVGRGSFFGVIRESFAGAWQRNVEVETCANILAFGAVYACITRIADDISKMRIKLVEQADDGTWNEVARASPYLRVLVKPNLYQTRIQFLNAWLVSKLIYGNAYILKEYDATGIVSRMHVLDPRLVRAVVAPDGAVYYQLQRDHLAGVPDVLPTVPARFIIHDRCSALGHPLIGTSPIYACGSSATQGIRIQANSAKFFENMSRPSGQLTAPGKIDEVTEKRLKSDFETNFSGGNIGRLLVTGNGLKYEPMTIPPVDAQLIQQLEWTVRDVAACYHMPLYKINAGPPPTVGNIGALNQAYYDETLQVFIESIELLLDEGLGLLDIRDRSYGTELDLDALLRMDPQGRAEVEAKLTGAGIMSPNEARLRENLPPVDGGESPMLQQQNYALAALAKRDKKDDPFKADTPPPAPVAPAAGGAAPPADGTPPPGDAAAPAAGTPSDAEAKIAELFTKELIARFDSAELVCA